MNTTPKWEWFCPMHGAIGVLATPHGHAIPSLRHYGPTKWACSSSKLIFTIVDMSLPENRFRDKILKARARNT